MNFLIKEMTYLRYFMPLVSEGNKNGVISKFFVGKSGKYNCPNLPKHKSQLKTLTEEFNIQSYQINEVTDHPGLTFLIEGVGVNYTNDSHKKASMTYMTDFRGLYDNYIDHVDNVIFPSKSIATHYGKINPKNLYLGSTKYDTNLSVEECLELTGLSKDEKYALIIYPRYRDLSKFPIRKIIESIKSLGMIPIIKSRGKEPCTDLMGCLYYEDTSWFPHTTMLLLECVDIVVNTGSTAIKECIMQRKPVINFNLKPHFHLPFLYQYDFCEQANFKNFNKETFQKSIERLLKNNFTKSFDECIDHHLGNLLARLKIR